MLESALIKYHSLLVSLSRGKPTSVDFNWDEIWSFRKRLGDGFNPEALTFYHIHPRGCLGYSTIDLNCIKGFNLAFGYPVLFSIICFKTNIIGDLGHNMIAYRYIDKCMVKEKPAKLRFVDLQILKELSYGASYQTS